MTLSKFEILLGRIEKLCDQHCTEKEKARIENDLIKLWNDYMALKGKQK